MPRFTVFERAARVDDDFSRRADTRVPLRWRTRAPRHVRRIETHARRIFGNGNESCPRGALRCFGGPRAAKQARAKPSRIAFCVSATSRHFIGPAHFGQTLTSIANTCRSSHAHGLQRLSSLSLEHRATSALTRAVLMSAITVRVGIRLLGTAKKVFVAATPITCGTRLACVTFFDTVIARLFAFRPQDQASINLELVESSIFLRLLATSCTAGQNENGKNEHQYGFESCHPTWSFLLIAIRCFVTLS